MFITDEDYRVVIGDAALKTVSQTSAENRANAESEAQEEISSYLRPVYDCKAVFAAEGDGRNKLMGSEIRKERYERAVKWLEGVQAGKIVPDLPVCVDATGEPSGIGVVFHSQKPLRHNW